MSKAERSNRLDKTEKSSGLDQVEKNGGGKMEQHGGVSKMGNRGDNMESLSMPVHRGEIEVSPAEVGYDERQLDVLDRHFVTLIEEREIQAASYLIARGGQVFAKRSMGKLQEDGEGGDFMPDSIRGIASITKVFTTISILQLMERGLLHLDNRVLMYLKEFDTEMHGNITIRHLLTHTAGIVADPGYFTEPYPRHWRRDMPKDMNWIEAVLQGPLLSEPGEVWNYSSSGYALLGEIISRVSGMNYYDYVKQNIIEPLGLNDTHFKVPEHKLARVCTDSEGEREWVVNVEEYQTPPRASGGMFSTLHDLFILGQLLLNKGTYGEARILGRKSVEWMTSIQLHGVPAFHWGAKYKDYPYGIGLHIYTDGIWSKGTFAHEGAGRCGLYMDPVEDLLLVHFAPMGNRWVERAMTYIPNIVWAGLR